MGRIEADAPSRMAVAALWTGAMLASLLLFLARSSPDPLVAGATLAAGAVLLLVAVHDERTFLIPDRLIVCLALIALSFHVARHPDELWRFAAAGAAGFGLLWATRALYRAWRGVPGLGLGDAKLIGAVGLLLGAEGLLGTLLLATATALSLSATLALAGKLDFKRDARIAFGSHIAFGAWTTWLWGPLLPASP